MWLGKRRGREGAQPGVGRGKARGDRRGTTQCTYNKRKSKMEERQKGPPPSTLLGSQVRVLGKRIWETGHNRRDMV